MYKYQTNYEAALTVNFFGNDRTVYFIKNGKQQNTTLRKIFNKAYATTN